MRRSIRIVLIWLLAFTWAPATGSSQELGFSVQQQWTDHDLLGSPWGIGVSGGIPVTEWLSFRVGWEGAGDRFNSFGSTCVGLIPPGEEASCAKETREETPTVNALTFSLPFRFLSSGPFDFRLVPAYRRVWLKSEQLGTVSQRKRSAKKEMSGLEFGLEAAYHPPWSRIVSLFGAFHTGLLNRYEDGVLIDGYSPFETDVAFGRFELGLSIANPGWFLLKEGWRS